jgi:hypothetical protein
MTMTEQVRQWCYAECERQHATTPADIAGMESAWSYAVEIAGRDLLININDLATMAELIDQAANPGGRFRTGPAVFMDGGTASPAYDIERKLNELLSVVDMPAWFIYRELMYVHPFRDGNGRVGALVYNILNGTINKPVVPPPYK